MYRVMCYGDSNTWGFIAITCKRYPEGVRWTSRLQNLLGSEYKIIEEGLNGRTTVWDDALSEFHNGKKMLFAALDSQSPLDAVILMLGTNDLKSRSNLNAFEIACGAEQLIQVIQNFKSEEQTKPIKIILVCPASILDNINDTPTKWFFSLEHSVKTSKQLPDFYRDLANKYGCEFIKADDITEVSKEDSLHFTENGHKLFADGILPIVKKVCERE